MRAFRRFRRSGGADRGSDAITRATGNAPLAYTLLVLAAWRGDETRALELIDAPGIGARLFLSPRAVQYHLGNVFAKLGISSRSRLDRVDLPGGRVAV